MKTEINPGYGWITCPHDDPEREEFHTLSGYEPVGPDKCASGHKGRTYRKRPLAPDGLKFSDPKCGWEMVPEGDEISNYYRCTINGTDWSDCGNGGRAGVGWRNANCYARRKQPAAQPKQDGWRYFATDGAPKEGDWSSAQIVEVCAVGGADVDRRIFEEAETTLTDWHPRCGWTHWRIVHMPPLPPIPPQKSAGELAWEELPSGELLGDTVKNAWIKGFNAALKSKDEK